METRQRCWGLAALLLLTGCGDDKARAWETLRASNDRWYRMAWGRAMEPATVDAEHRRFDCVWDALSRVGRDPREDVACYIRQVDFVVACVRPPASSPSPDDYRRLTPCAERSRTVCPLSPDYERAAQTCRGPVPH